MNITPRMVIEAAEYVDAHGALASDEFALTGLSNCGEGQIIALVQYAKSIGWASHSF